MRKGLLLLGILALLALALPSTGAGIWRLLFRPAFVLAIR